MNDNDNLDTIRDRIKARREAYWIENGQDLIKAKAQCGHGKFKRWLRTNFGWSVSTAQNYMNAARLADEKPQLAVLNSSALIALAAPNTPEIVKAEVIAEIAAGKIPSSKEINSKIAVAKAASAKPSGSRSSATVSGLAPASGVRVANRGSVESDLVERLKAAGFDAASQAFRAAFPGYTIFTVLERDLKAA